MADPSKSAFCPLYFSAHGGQFNDRGLALFNGMRIPGVCDRAFDCGTCSLMSKWVNEMMSVGWAVGWECDRCLKDTYLADKSSKTGRILPGFYQSSQPDDKERGYIDGCTRCGWQTSFLQIILRRQHG